MNIFRKVPASLKSQYISSGWTETNNSWDNDNWLKYEIESNDFSGSNLEIKQSPLYLIQRAKIRRPLADVSKTFSKSLVMDYMGSAEFEWGALPLSLKRIKAQFPMYKKHTIKEIALENTLKLKVFGNFDEYHPLEQYVEWLKQLRDNQACLKEISGFEKKYWNNGRFDVWWDIKNDVIWSFDKNFMNRIEKYLTNSFSIL